MSVGFVKMIVNARSRPATAVAGASIAAVSGAIGTSMAAAGIVDELRNGPGTV